MAQRPGSGQGVSKSTLPSGYEDPKNQFDKRVAIETKKVNELLNQVEKGRAQLDAERRAYCIEFKKNLQAYASDETIFTPTYLSTIMSIIKKLDELDQHYLLAIRHMQDVAMPGLGYLPKRFEALKKSIKVAKQSPADIPKIRDFEYERIENIKFALLHFFNAKMYLHAKALELYSQAYDTMRAVSLKTEFRHVDQGILRQVITANPHIIGTPRGNSSNSARQSPGDQQHARNSSNDQSPNPALRQASNSPAQPQRPGSAQAQQQQQKQQQASSQGQQRAQSAGPAQQQK